LSPKNFWFTCGPKPSISPCCLFHFWHCTLKGNYLGNSTSRRYMHRGKWSPQH